jgi:hypothetical protein
MRVIFLALAIISGCGDTENLLNGIAEPSVTPTLEPTPTTSITPLPTTSTTSTTSTTTTSSKCQKKNTTPTWTVTEQPDLPSDWKYRLNSWPLSYWSDAVETCKTTVIDTAKECQEINSAVLTYAETTCGCMVTGLLSLVYYPNSLPTNKADMWGNWCAYRYLVKGYLTDTEEQNQ